MRILSGLYVVILGLALTPMDSFAGNLRSQKEVHAELVALEALGIQDKAFKGLSLVPSEEVFNNSDIFYPLLDTVQGFVKDARHGSLFNSSDDNRLIKQEHVQSRMFRVLVELLRYGIRSEDRLIRGLTLGRINMMTAIDYDLIDDVIALALSSPEQSEGRRDQMRDALHCFERCMSFSMDDDGKVEMDLHGKNGPAAGAYIRMKLLAPWSAKAPKENRAERMLRSGHLLSYSYGHTPLEGWKIISDFVKNEWESSPIDIKKALIDVVEGLSLREHDAVDLMLELDKSKRNVPLKIALIKSMRQFAFEYEKAAKWIRLMAEDPSPSVRAEAAFAIGHHGQPGDVDILNRMFARDSDQNVRIRAVFALGSFWEKHGTTDTREIAFAKLAKEFVGSTGPFRNSFGRALSMWLGIPPTSKVAYGLTSSVVKECEKAVFEDKQGVGTAAAMEDIWAEEAPIK